MAEAKAAGARRNSAATERRFSRSSSCWSASFGPSVADTTFALPCGPKPPESYARRGAPSSKVPALWAANRPPGVSDAVGHPPRLPRGPHGLRVADQAFREREVAFFFEDPAEAPAE